MLNELNNNMYIDQLTGLPNFFEFINIDTVSTFGDFGFAIVFDIENFKVINDLYGHDFGDVCLKSFASVIVHILERYNNMRIFRIGGDEFTIILPHFLLEDAEEIMNTIEKNYKVIMNQQISGVDINVHKILLDYSGPVENINDFFKIFFTKLYGQNEKLLYKYWPNQLINNFIRRIKETLDISNNAYSLALYDDVSGLPNHRAASIYLNDLISNNLKADKQFSLLFIDGDDLRRYNNIGYQSGNKMIKELSTVILNSVRKDDKVFRWLSGDEFIVVFDETNCQIAYDLAERIRITVEEETINWDYPVTVSIGVSNFPNDGQTIDDIVNNAEKANKYAKDAGKNKVVRWDFVLKA